MIKVHKSKLYSYQQIPKTDYTIEYALMAR